MRTNNNTIFCIVIGFLLALSASAQDKMYIMKNGTPSHIITLSNIDSVIFYQPEGKIGIGEASLTTDPGVIINGVTWATRNVNQPGQFAANEGAQGMAYQWNRKIGWSLIELINSDGGTTWDNTNKMNILERKWSAINDPCPVGWRVPTSAEFKSLVNSVASEWIVVSYAVGKKFGSFENSIFLPASGFRNSDGTLRLVGEVGFYWSSDETSNNADGQYIQLYEASQISFFQQDINSAMSVRCVLK
jgi:uncharacterized protein (TIGR02145 family)